jgi:hypothetical protein
MLEAVSPAAVSRLQSEQQRVDEKLRKYYYRNT